MTRHLSRSLAQLRYELLDQFSAVETMVCQSIDALIRRDVALSHEVIARDELIDETDIRIEEDCLKLLALHQPVTTDLRWVTTLIKVNSELERMADLACNISERAISLGQHPDFPVPDELTPMVETATEMVRDVLDAFVEGDTKLAMQVIERDQMVDRQNDLVIDILQQFIQSHPDQVAPAMHCFSVSRMLEQIADIAESVSKDVIYLVEGEIIRHQHGTGPVHRSVGG